MYFANHSSIRNQSVNLLLREPSLLFSFWKEYAKEVQTNLTSSCQAIFYLGKEITKTL